MSHKCARCGKQVSKNIYYCSEHDWHLCWDCINKATFSNKLTCYKCGKEVQRVD